MVANVLKGKAFEAYDRMSVEDLEDYEEFKSIILRVYELRSEAYRLQFRGARKKDPQTPTRTVLIIWRRRWRSGCCVRMLTFLKASKS